MTLPISRDAPTQFDSGQIAAAQWLVSVRCLAEAEVVASVNVSIIDFKEPSRGPLAPVGVDVWNEAADRFGDRPLSAALGEKESAKRLASEVPPSFQFAKVGPSGVATTRQLARLWDQLALPTDVELVPVAYADHANANCPEVASILETVIAENRTRLLIDTFRKDGQGLRDHLSDGELTTLLTRARQAGIWLALAGSIRLEQVTELNKKNLSPNCWGVRGDVCVGEMNASRREGSIDPVRLQRWSAALQPWLTGQPNAHCKRN